VGRKTLLARCVNLETRHDVLNQQSDEPTAPSTPRESAVDSSQCHSPFSPSDPQHKRGSQRLRFVDVVTSAK